MNNVQWAYACCNEYRVLVLEWSKAKALVSSKLLNSITSLTSTFDNLWHMAHTLDLQSRLSLQAICKPSKTWHFRNTTVQPNNRMRFLMGYTWILCSTFQLSTMWVPTNANTKSSNGWQCIEQSKQTHARRGHVKQYTRRRYSGVQCWNHSAIIRKSERTEIIGIMTEEYGGRWFTMHKPMGWWPNFSYLPHSSYLSVHAEWWYRRQQAEIDTITAF